MQPQMHETPTGQAAGEDTKPHLDTAWLDQRLESFNGEAVSVAGAFQKKSPHNFPALFTSVAALAGKAWKEWERKGASPLTEAADEVVTALDSWEAGEPATLATNFKTEITRLNGKLSDGYETAINRQLADEEANKPDADKPEESIAAQPGNETRLKIVERGMKRMRVTYTGHPEGHIPAPRTEPQKRMDKVITVAIMAAAVIAEAIGGFLIFRNRVGSRGGIVMAFAFALVFLVLDIIAAPASRRLAHWIGATLSFSSTFPKDKFPKGVRDDTGKQILLQPFRFDNALTAVFTSLIVFVGSGYLFIWRKTEAANNDLLTGAVIAAAAVLLMTIALWIVKFVRESGFDEQVLIDYHKLDEEFRLLKKAEAEAQSLKDAAAANSEDDPNEDVFGFTAVEQTYEDGVADARAAVSYRIAQIAAKIEEYKRLVREYRKARKINLAQGYHTLAVAMLTQIFTKNKQLDRSRFSTPESMTEATLQLEAACPAILEDRELLARIKNTKLVVNLDESLVITEFSSEIQRVHDKITAAIDEAEQRAGSAHLQTLVAMPSLGGPPDDAEDEEL